MLISLVPPFVLVAGLLLYGYSSANAKMAEVGKAGLWVGLFWTVGMLVHKVVHFP